MSEVGDSVTAGAMPVPLSEIVCGDPDALSAIESVAGRAPVAVGSKMTEMTQFAAAAIVAPQVLVVV